MEKLTHVAFSNMIALSVLRPDSFESLAATVGMATLGGLISDVDLKNSDIDKVFDKLMIAVCSVLMTAVVFNHFFDLKLFDLLKNINYDIRPYVSGVVFIVLAFLGSKTPHRSFTHSFMGIIIYSFVVYFGFNKLFLYPFTIGMLTHVFLDFFNKTGIEIFYPFQKRIALKLCESDGFVNHMIFMLSSLVNTIILGVLILKIIF